MEELIKIQETKNGKAVSARELYTFLDFTSSQWSRWYQQNIINEDYFVEGADYVAFDIVSNGNPTKDFALSLDMAKELSILARTEKGKVARRYFIECERKLKEVQALPKSLPEALRLYADSVEREEKAMLELGQAKEQIEADKPKVVFAESVTGSNNSILIR